MAPSASKWSAMEHDFQTNTSVNAVVKGCEKSCARQRTCYNHEKGREIMCESVEKYADKKSETKRINALAEAVKMLMEGLQLCKPLK